MYSSDMGSKGASGSVFLGSLLLMAVWAPTNEKKRNIKVPQNSPIMMTIALRGPLGIPRCLDLLVSCCRLAASTSKTSLEDMLEHGINDVWQKERVQ